VAGDIYTSTLLERTVTAPGPHNGPDAWYRPNIRFQHGSYSNFKPLRTWPQRRLQRHIPAVQRVRDRGRFDPLQSTGPHWCTTQAARTTETPCGSDRDAPGGPVGQLHDRREPGRTPSRRSSVPTNLRVPARSIEQQRGMNEHSDSQCGRGRSDAPSSWPRSPTTAPRTCTVTALSKDYRYALGRERRLEGLFGRQLVRRIRQEGRSAAGEKGGIRGEVDLRSTQSVMTRSLLLPTSWTKGPSRA